MNKKNILIVKLSAIGDLVMALPSFEAIRNKNPSAKVTLLVGKWAGDVVRNNPNIDEIFVVDENIFWRKNIIKLFMLFIKLKKAKYDTVYIMHWSNLFNLYFYLIGIKNRISFSREGKAKYLTRSVYYSESRENKLIHQKYLELVDPEIKIEDYKMKIYLDEEEIKNAESIFKEFNILKEKELIGISPGGGYNPKRNLATKRWPVEYFVKLIDMITKEMESTVILFGCVEETDIAEYILKNIKEKSRCFNFIGRFNLRITFALISKCSVMISNDSGLMHSAIALEVPTVSIFGPTNPFNKIIPSEKNVIIYKNIECSPCYKYGIAPFCKEHRCMREVEPEEVFKSVRKLLKFRDNF